MDEKKKLKLLKSIHLLDNIPENELASLSKFLEPANYLDQAMIFEEGSKGDTLFFLWAGQVKVVKKVKQAEGGIAFKDLAVLNPGDCFGEMALFEEVPRSASAMAVGDTLIFKLSRKELMSWLKKNPTLAVGFFAELVQILSGRLRRTSSESTLLYDLTQWLLLEPSASGTELMRKVFEHLLPHLDGNWAAGAYLYNEFNAEMDLVAAENGFEEVPPTTLGEAASRVAANRGDASAWLNERCFLVGLPGKLYPKGYLVFLKKSKLAAEDQNEMGRLLTIVGRLITSALENINFRAENAMRDRLKISRSYVSGF